MCTDHIILQQKSIIPLEILQFQRIHQLFQPDMIEVPGARVKSLLLALAPLPSFSTHSALLQVLLYEYQLVIQMK